MTWDLGRFMFQFLFLAAVVTGCSMRRNGL